MSLSPSLSPAPQANENDTIIQNDPRDEKKDQQPTDDNPATATNPPKRKPSRRANTAERRATHNAVERQRRETLNGRFLDLAALLPNLSQIRRPSKSSIVNSSIAHINASRRHRMLASRELRLLKSEADLLRREVNEWRDRAGIPRSEEPLRSDAFTMVVSGELDVALPAPGGEYGDFEFGGEGMFVEEDEEGEEEWGSASGNISVPVNPSPNPQVPNPILNLGPAPNMPVMAPGNPIHAGYHHGVVMQQQHIPHPVYVEDESHFNNNGFYPEQQHLARQQEIQRQEMQRHQQFNYQQVYNMKGTPFAHNVPGLSVNTGSTERNGMFTPPGTRDGPGAASPAHSAHSAHSGHGLAPQSNMRTQASPALLGDATPPPLSAVSVAFSDKGVRGGSSRGSGSPGFDDEDRKDDPRDRRNGGYPSPPASSGSGSDRRAGVMFGQQQSYAPRDQQGGMFGMGVNVMGAHGGFGGYNQQMQQGVVVGGGNGGGLFGIML